MSILALQHNQNPADKPHEALSRSAAQTLVRKGRAEWIERNRLIRRLPQGKIRLELNPKPTGPIQRDRNNPPELPGLKFELNGKIINPNVPQVGVVLFKREELARFPVEQFCNP